MVSEKTKSSNKFIVFRVKFLAVFMSVLLLMSMVNTSAFAEVDGSGKKASTTSEEASGDSQTTGSAGSVPSESGLTSKAVAFELQDSYVKVSEQSLVDTKVKVPAGSNLVFTAYANTGFTDPVVSASSSAHSAVPVEKDGDTYTIDSSYITDDSLKVTVTSSVEPNTDESTNETQSGEGSKSEGASKKSTSGVAPQAAVSPSSISDISSPNNGTKNVSLTILNEVPETIEGVPTIVKPSGETASTRFSVLSSSLEGVIIAIPKHPDAEIGLDQGDSRITTGTVPVQVLIDAGIAVDTSYDNYFILVSNRSASGNGDVVQFPTITFTFNNGSTTAGSMQPIEAYVLDGVLDPANEILSGSNVAISATPNLVKLPDGDSTVIKADVEKISLAKTIKEISDGGMSASGIGTDLDPRSFADSSSATYDISYTLSLQTTRDKETNGRLKVDGDFLIYDKLENFRSDGTPTSITVKGPNGETIATTTPSGGKTDTSWEFYFKAILDANAMVTNGDYIVTVTYTKDAYTDKYTQTGNLLGARQIITNKAWMNYSTHDGASVNSFDAAIPVSNAIGYKQLAPDSIELKVQKKITLKSATYNYDAARQAMYPEDAETESKVVTFTLTPQSGEGTQPITAIVNSDGVATLIGLKPNTTYTLAETQGIENFTALSTQTVVVGALIDDRVTITINGNDYYGETFEAVNKAQRDGAIEATVTKQDNTLTAATLGQYASASGILVELFDADSPDVLLAKGTSDGNGKVKFENLDPTKTYVLKAATSQGTTLVPNEATITPANFDSSKDATAEIKYTSTYGAMKIGKNFIAATGSYAGTTSGLSATFRLVDKNASNYPSTYLPITLSAQGEVSAASLYSMQIPAGEYELYEWSVSGGTSAQYTVDQTQKIADNIVVTGGKFDAYNQVITNTSTYGELKIQNFDYGNTPLTVSGFKYTVSYVEGGATYYVNASGVSSTTRVELTMASGKSELSISVPSGRTYTVEQFTTPAGFELVKNSGSTLGSATVTVTQNTAAGSVSVGSLATTFTITEGTQVVGFVNATLPNAEGTKVNVLTNTTSDHDALSGATFAIYKLNGAEYKYVGTAQSNASGKITLTSLSDGEYRLIETTAPQGFALPAYAQALASTVTAKNNLSAAEGQLAPKIVVSKSDYSSTTAKQTVFVDATGTLNALADSNMDKTMIPNSPLVQPEIKMVGVGGGGEVTGGVFEIYNSSGTLIGTATSDSSGYVKFTSDGTSTGTVIGLTEGTYTIKQTDLNGDATEYVKRADAVVTITINDKGEVTSSGFTVGEDYANSETDGASITFSNAKKPSIKIYKLGETNVFETVEVNGQMVTQRTQKPITGAVFTVEDANTGEGLIIDDGKYTGEQGTASEITSIRGNTGVSLLDPNGTYLVTEKSAPNVEGTELRRQIVENIPPVEFELVTNDQNEITGYQIKGQSQGGGTDSVKIENSTLTLIDRAEDTYQIQVSKYGLGTNNGAYGLDNPSAKGVYEDGVNTKFLIQKQNSDGEWITVETITTGTSSVDNTGKLNLALSSDLPAGTYRIVEVQSGIYAPDISSGTGGNSLYGLKTSGTSTADLSNWEKLSAEKISVTLPESDDPVTGLVWPETIVLGSNGTHTDPNNPYDVKIGNDDERSEGVPWYGDYVVRLHGTKKAINRDLDAAGTAIDTVTGDIASVQFEVSFGWATLVDGEYKLIEDEPLARLSNVVSGSADGKGDFITEYVTFKAWDIASAGGTPAYEDISVPANAVPCFILVELGPVPAHIVKPTDETKTTILPFSIPNMGNADPAKGGYYTIDADDILPSESGATGGVTIKNFEAEGLLQINKYSSVDKDVDKDDRTVLKEGVFNVYQALQAYDANDNPIEGEYTCGTLQAVIDLSSGSNEVELLAGNYFVKEVTAPEKYNLNGWWQYNGGSMTEFVNGELVGLIEVSELDASSEENEAEVMNFFDAPYAQINIVDYWDTDQLDGEKGSYRVTYSGSYATQFITNSHLTQDGVADVDVASGVLRFDVNGKNTTELYNLPDGTYTIVETSINGASATYHKNSKASAYGIQVIIKNGDISETVLAGSPGSISVNDTGLSWRSIDNEFDTKGTDNPQKDNIIREDTGGTTDTGKGTANSADVTTLKLNHLPKSSLAIKMGYIDEVNDTQDNKHYISSATFLIEGTGTNSAFSEGVTWNGTDAANLLTVPLDPGVYKVTQTAVTSSETNISYSMVDNTSAWVLIGTSGTLTYLQNNTDEYAKAKVSAESDPLQRVPTLTSAAPFFYNKINAGRLVVYKTDGSTKNALSGAAFTVKNQSDVAYSVNTVSGGTHTYNSLPAEQTNGEPDSGTTYNITETGTPSKYYVDGSIVSTVVKPNYVNEVTVENVPFTSITIHKDAQMPTYVDIKGQTVSGATHAVEGLIINLYKKNGSGGDLIGTKTTDAFGNLTFTDLDVGSYRIEEPSTVTVDGNSVANLSYLDFSKAPLYSESNTSYHFDVVYTSSATNSEKAVAIDSATGININGDSYDVAYDDTTNTINILNHYDDDTLFIPVMKIDAETGEPVAGATFRLTGEEGNALRSADNSAVIYATTNSDGVAYFHFLPDNIKKSSNLHETYEGAYYIREINATDAYVISPYKNDYLKLSVFEGTSQTANLLVFENEKKVVKPGLEVEKTAAATLEAPLTQSGFDATYTITPSFTDSASNELPLVNYTVADKGFVFQDANNAKIVDSRMKYTVKEVTVGQTTTVDNQTIYASLDKGNTWKEVSSASATFTTSYEGSATDPAASLFEVWYATKSGNVYERVVGAGFDPGAITVKVMFDQFIMIENEATSNDVAKIVNNVSIDVQYPTSKEETGWEALTTAKDDATVTLPTLPTMSIKKDLVTNAGEVKRGAEVKYRVTLTNDSDKTIVNPTIIDRPEPITYGTSHSDNSVRVKVVNGKPDLQKVEFSGQAQDIASLGYQSYVWNNGATAAWVFADSLEPNQSISIEFSVTIDKVVMSDSITNTAYGTSLLSFDDLSKMPTYYALDNPEGALFKPTTSGQLADNYAAINAITGLNGGIYIKDSVISNLEKTQALTPQKQISTDGVNWVNDTIDILPGQSYYYRLQVQWDDVEGGLDLGNISIYDVIPQVADGLGTNWTDDFISLLKFSEFRVEGHDNQGDYRTFIEGADYDVYYFTDALYNAIKGRTDGDSNWAEFTSFRVKMDDSFVLSPKHAITIIYKVEVPDVSDDGSTEFSYEELEDNALQDGASRFVTEYGIKNAGMEAPLRSNTVTAHLLAPETDLVGTVWDDQNRNGTLEDEATQADRKYIRNTLDLADVTVVLYKQAYDSAENMHGEFVELATATRGNGLLKADGTYNFTGLESSYGEKGPNYKVEFVYEQGDDNYARPLTHAFSTETAFVKDGSTKNKSHVVNKRVNGVSTAAVSELGSIQPLYGGMLAEDANKAVIGDTGSLRLLQGNMTAEGEFGTANIVNAGYNALPFKVIYDYGTAPAGASALPASQVYIYEDAVTVEPKATAPGYTFVGWSHDNFSMPPHDVTITGTWVAQGDTPYTVEYYFQNANGNGYKRGEGDKAGYSGTGKTDTEVTALVKNFAGFIHNPEASGTLLSSTIKGDGSTILRVYYDLDPDSDPVDPPVSGITTTTTSGTSSTTAAAQTSDILFPLVFVLLGIVVVAGISLFVLRKRIR